MSIAYRLSAAADRDLEGIYRYTVETWGYEQADAYLRGLDSLFSNIADQPKLGAPRPDLQHGIRTRRYRSHTVYYRITEDAIYIIRVLHGRQDALAALSP